MKDEDLLQEIGRRLREEALDERWRHLAEGSLSESEEKALRAEVERSEEARLDYEAMKPLGPDFRERMLRRLHERTAAPREAGEPPEGPATARPRVLPFRRLISTKGRWLAVAASLVVAVGLVAILFDGPAPGDPLPVYSSTLTGVQSSRSPAEGELPVLVPGLPFAFEARPERLHEEPIEVRLVFRDARGIEHGWVGEKAVSTGGAIRIEGRIEPGPELLPGEWTASLLYGRPGRLPPPGSPLPETPESEDRWGIEEVSFLLEAGGPSAGASSAGGAALEVEYAGCFEVLPGPSCVPYSELTLWVRPPAIEALWVGDRAVEVADLEAEPVDGGLRLRVAVSHEDGEIGLRAAGQEWRIALVASSLPAWLRDAMGKAAAGEAGGEILALLRAHLEDPEPGAAARAGSLLARLLSEEATAERAALLERAAALHRDADQLWGEVQDVLMLVHANVEAWRFEAGRRRLDGLRLEANAPAEAKLQAAYHRGVLEREAGDYREALAALETALALAHRLGDPLEPAAEQALGTALQAVGRVEEAMALYGRPSWLLDDPCDRARLLNNHAWVRILSPGAAGASPLALLESAHGVGGLGGCAAGLRLNLALNRALALVEAGREGAAGRALAEAAALRDVERPSHRQWRWDVEARLALRSGDAEQALARFERQEALARGAFLPEALWRAKVGQAQARAALGEAEAAVRLLEEAEVLLDGAALAVPIHQGRERFVALKEEASRLQLELLLDAGRVEESLAAARRSRARGLRGLLQGHRLASLGPAERQRWQRAVTGYLVARARIEAESADDWQLSAAELEGVRLRRAEGHAAAGRLLDGAYQVLASGAEASGLPPLGTDEVLLVYHPLPEGSSSGRWAAFGASAGRVETERVDLPPLDQPEALAQALLEPFRGLIESATRVRVLPSGVLRAVDFHALPWDGDVLLATRPVVYGLDGAATASPLPALKRALVLADPRRDLPAAAFEGEEVRRVLGAPGATWSVRLLEGEEASAAAVLAELASGGEPEPYDLLHYAGHGVFGGAGGWQSALLLAANTRLLPGDVLALGKAPRWVVLSSCEAAREPGGSTAAGLGLAQAFLVAGSEAVVAATRPVDDEAARGLVARFYRGWGAPGGFAMRFRDAQLAWRRGDPGGDWASFRLLMP